MLWLKAFHLIGIVLWFGSLLQVTRLLKTHARAPEPSHATLYDVERRTQLFVGFPGLLLTVGCGLAMLTQNASFYMKQGWMHAKLTAVIVAIVLDVLLFRAIRAYKDAPKGVLLPLLLHIFSGLTLIAMMVLMKVWAAKTIPAAL